MGIAKLFETQKVLRERINYNEPDRFDKLKLALLVEVGECANEWKKFKFWSNRQKPITVKRIECEKCVGTGLSKSMLKDCKDCKGSGTIKINPLLMEYVDGLHFVLELGIEIGSTNFEPTKLISFRDTAIVNDFMSIYYLIVNLDHGELLFDDSDYKTLFNNYIKLGELLRFTWEEIEIAYFEKNAINHERQRLGY